MPQLACNIEGPRQPFSVKGAGSANMTAFLQGDIALHWAGVGTPDAYAAASATITTVAGTQHVDASITTWLIATYQGAAQLYFVSLDDALTTGLESIFTTLAGSAQQWAILAWIEGTSSYQYPQAATSFPGVPITLDPAAGAPVEGDLLYYHGGKWELIHIGSDRQVVAVKFGDPAWDDLADVLKAILTTDGDILANISGTVTRIALGSDRQVVAVKFGEPGYHDISDILLSIPPISPAAGVYRALILDGSGVPGFALVNVP